MSVLDLFKMAASTPLKGKLYLSKTGFLLLSVPNAIGRGAFDALNEAGIELPLSTSSGNYNAHITVMRPEELESFGGAGKITERGHEFGYSLGKINDFNPIGWPEVNRCWVMEVASPELEKLRRTYGLPALPHGGEYKFHVTIAVRRSGVLGSNSIAKVTDSGVKSIKLTDKPGIHLRKASADKCPGCGRQFKKDEPYPDVDMCEVCERYGPPKEVSAGITVGQAVARAAVKATSPKSDAQAEAGNYQKGHVNMHGLSVTIENKRGSERSGTDENGKQWAVTLQNHYGYIRRTMGKDGDQVDVFVGPDPECELVYVVDQVNPKNQKFDEHKCMMGFKALKDAKTAYLDNYETGWKGLGKITPVTMQQFREWLQDGSQQRPISTQMFKMKKAASDSVVGGGPDILVLQHAQMIRLVPPQ